MFAWALAEIIVFDDCIVVVAFAAGGTGAVMEAVAFRLVWVEVVVFEGVLLREEVEFVCNGAKCMFADDADADITMALDAEIATIMESSRTMESMLALRVLIFFVFVDNSINITLVLP